jgi:hypothetical protein
LTACLIILDQLGSLSLERSCMKKPVMLISAALFAAALALPAFAQVGAGIAGNGTVGDKPTVGANPDVANSDATHTVPNDTDAASSMPPVKRADRHSKLVVSERNRAVGMNAGVNRSEGSLGAKAGTDNSATGGY